MVDSGVLSKKHKVQIQNFYKKQGKVAKNNFFLIKFVSTELVFSRFGVVVSSKVDGRASKRNQIRRAVYRCIKASNLQLKEGKDVMITALPAVKELNMKQISQNLEPLLDKIYI